MKRGLFAVLLLLLFLAGAIWAVERVKAELETSFSQILHTSVRIDRLTFSPRRLTLHRIALADSSVVIERLQLEGSLWKKISLESLTVTDLTLRARGIPLQGRGRLFLSNFSTGAASCEGILSFTHPGLTGQVEVSGTILEPILYGWVEGPGGFRRRFVGRLQMDHETIDLQQMEIEGGYLLTGAWEPAAKATSLRLTGPSGRYELKVAPNVVGGGRLLLRAHPEDGRIRDMAASWIVKDDRLSIIAGFFGDSVMLQGWVGLKPPYPTHLATDFNGVDIQDAFLCVLPQGHSTALSGEIFGHINFEGPLSRLTSVGELRTGQGKLGRLEFIRCAIRFQGAGSLLRIQNSQVTRTSGLLLLEGNVDLRRVGRPDFFRQVKLSSMERTLGLGSWQMGPTPGGPGLQMQRSNPGGGATVELAYERDTSVQSESVERQKVELDYPISENENITMRMDRDDGFVGVEHRGKF